MPIISYGQQRKIEKIIRRETKDQPLSIQQVASIASEELGIPISYSNVYTIACEIGAHKPRKRAEAQEVGAEVLAELRDDVAQLKDMVARLVKAYDDHATSMMLLTEQLQEYTSSKPNSPTPCSPNATSYEPVKQ